jgi:hypothetical protein
MQKGLAIDCDGVLLCFSGPFSAWWNRHFAAEHGFTLVENPEVWAFDSRLTEAQLQPYVERFISTEPLLPLVSPDIPAHMASLRKAGFALHVVTAWPEKWSESRLRNLRHHGIEYDTIEFVPLPVESWLPSSA